MRLATLVKEDVYLPDRDRREEGLFSLSSDGLPNATSAETAPDVAQATARRSRSPGTLAVERDVEGSGLTGKLVGSAVRLLRR